MAANSIATRLGAVSMLAVLENDLGNVASGISQEVDEVLREQADKIAASARSKVPVGTGNLRDSIEVVEDDRPGYTGYRVVADARSRSGKYEVPYAHMVEYGSVHNQPPQPFLTPALEEHRQETLDAVGEAIEKAAEG